MRIKLKKGKQKELLSKFKENNNFTWKQFSAFLSISISSLMEYNMEKNLLPLKIYKKLDIDNKYSNYIIGTRKENWGRAKGGLNSIGSLKKIKIPKFSNELAELVGIVLGDGNIHSYKKGKKIGVYSLRIAGDGRKDKDYHLSYIVPLCESLFGLNAKIQEYTNKNERFVSMYSRELVNYLSAMGLKSGDKIKNSITIPAWIFKNEEYLGACIRGLIDTDGSVFRMSKRDYKLIRINFTNNNKKLLEDTRKALIVLGFNPSNIICNNKIYLSRKEDVVKYIKEIGFSNSKHQKRFDKFKNSSLV